MGSPDAARDDDLVRRHHCEPRTVALEVPAEPGDGGIGTDRLGRAWQRRDEFASAWTVNRTDDPHPPRWYPAHLGGNADFPGPEYMRIPAAWPALLALLGPVTVHWEGEVS